MKNSMNEYYKKLGKRIKFYRDSKNPPWSGAKLSEMSKLSAVTINNIENGKLPKVSLDALRKIARALDIPMSMLVDDEISVEAARTIEIIKSVLKNEPSRTNSKHNPKK